MKEYEYLSVGNIVVCKRHDRVKCNECAYIHRIEVEKEIYKKALVQLNDFVKRGENECDIHQLVFKVTNGAFHEVLEVLDND